MATLLGTDGVFGLVGETGILTHKVKFDYSHDTAELEDENNEVIAAAFTKEKVDIGIDGKVSGTSPFSGALASVLTLINDMPDHLNGSITAGTVYVDGISIEKDKGDYNDISVKAIYRPSLVIA